MSASQIVSVCRDEDCPECGYPETYAVVDFARVDDPGADEIGCRKCGWSIKAPTEPERPEPMDMSGSTRGVER